jgi:rod shape-determining protein MreD
MMAYLLLAVMFVAGIAVQTSVLALLFPGGVHPDILLPAVIILALLSDARRGAILGFAAGLLQDIVFAAPLGFFAFGKILAGVLAGLLAREVHKDLLLSPVLIVMVLTVLVETATFLQRYLLFTGSPFFASYLAAVVLPRMAAHALLTLLLYPLFYRLYKKARLLADHET